MPKLNPYEFSKRIMICLIVMTFIVVITVCVDTFYSGDQTALNILIPSIFAELATATGFYYKKAEKENVERIKKKAGSGEIDA